MKKLISLFLLVSIAALGFSGCKAEKINNKNVLKVENIISLTKTADLNEVVIPTKMNRELADVYYPIVGESKNLSPRERAAMEKSRKRVVELAKANKGTMFINGPTNKKVVALTFDDGPDSRITGAMLDVLRDNNVKGSFFFVGNRLKSHAEVVKRADEEGNLVLIHSFSHAELTKLSPAEVNKELSQTKEIIFSLIGKSPAIVRPPYGDINQPTVNEIAKSNYKIVMWSIDTLDWSQREKDNIVRNVVDNVRPGDIILMHSIENNKASLEALPEIIKKLKDKGYEFLTLDKMLGISAYR
ncbi:polysaccharide deacetylase family protein [Clostridium sp. DJ247]|uniref:polysaccharide deacetylase family protein n=1 Tax=Clostridium sp. DJ247 TaxID=2726188 RepID=UPI001623623C|nr:polysaccharide deacetylase family protein [Clostridium sp. DJ247]MBC2582108.1 polysaccharide deacetylase family protein [Clostridium sp. DJ247]